MGKQARIHKLSDSILCHLENTAKIARVSAVRFFEEHEEINVSFHDFLILEALYANPKIHQRDLAKILFKGTANLSRDLVRLEDCGLIKRSIDVKAKRIVKTLMLTEEGERIFKDVSKISLKHVSEIEEIFTDEEYKQFLSYIERLQNRLTESVDMVFE